MQRICYPFSILETWYKTKLALLTKRITQVQVRALTLAPILYRISWSVLLPLFAGVLGGSAATLLYLQQAQAKDSIERPVVTDPLLSSPSVLESTLDGLRKRVEATNEELAKVQEQSLQGSTERQQLVDQVNSMVQELQASKELLNQKGAELSKALARLPTSTAMGASSAEQQSSNSSPVDSSTVKGKININSASVAELDTLPGIGPSYAERIVTYRNEHGLFASIDDLDKVSGIGTSTIEKIRDLVTI